MAHFLASIYPMCGMVGGSCVGHNGSETATYHELAHHVIVNDFGQARRRQIAVAQGTILQPLEIRELSKIKNRLNLGHCPNSGAQWELAM